MARCGKWLGAHLLLMPLVSMAAHAQALGGFEARRALGEGAIVADLGHGVALENLLVEGENIIATDLVQGAVLRINTRNGASRTLATLPGPITGIAPRSGGYVVAGVALGGQSVLYDVDRSGGFSVIAALPDGARANGLTLFAEDQYLVADSLGGRLFFVNLETRVARLWLYDERLGPMSRADPSSAAANGVRRRGDFVYVSNTQRRTLLRIGVIPSGGADRVEVLAENVAIDDFAIARDGAIFAALPQDNLLVRFAPDRSMTIVADETTGLRGPTAVAFGPRDNRAQTLYVTSGGQAGDAGNLGDETGHLVRVDLPPRDAVR